MPADARHKSFKIGPGRSSGAEHAVRFTGTSLPVRNERGVEPTTCVVNQWSASKLEQRALLVTSARLAIRRDTSVERESKPSTVRRVNLAHHSGLATAALDCCLSSTYHHHLSC
jgi:hypothetical protein